MAISIIPDVWGRRNLTSSRDLVRQFFNDWMGDWEGEAMRPMEEGVGFTAPRMDVTEHEKDIKVTAELPGLDEKDIELSINKDHLVLKGEKKEEKEEKEENFYRRERYFGSFRREVDLPCEVQNEKADAVFKKGILTISIPKSPVAMKEVKKIPIKTA
ncbi:MAG: Heat shock protein Hsp20 [uncultured bacterium]|nr:MAG: Heat shock protein Hsp20 [uncultured bacterium]